MSQRLNKALNIGLIAEIKGKSWSRHEDRPIVFCYFGGILVPFYRSKQGTEGKQQEKWYPFFGIGDDNLIIKGNKRNLETGYNGMFSKIQNILDKTFDWNEESLDLANRGMNNHPFYQSRPQGFLQPVKINQICFGKDKLGVIRGSNEDKHIEGICFSIIGKLESFIRYFGQKK